jgi:hypothetical protein
VAEGQPQSLLLTRALVRHLAAAWQPLKGEEEVLRNVEEGQQPLFEGPAYSDGSKLGTSEYGQVGWAVAGMHGGEPIEVAYGRLPTQLPAQRAIQRGELWGFLQLLTFAMPPIQTYISAQGT